MTRARVLVVRSGANPFVKIRESSAVEVVERSSHDIASLEPAGEVFSEPFDLCAFTSQVAVERVTRHPGLRAAFEGAVRRARIVAVGSATAEALGAHGIEADATGGGSVDALLETLPARMDGWRVLLPCGEDASAELPEELRRRGARVSRAVLYRKTPRPREPELEREILDRPFSAFCTTSPAAASWLFDGLGTAAADRLRATPAVVLGRFTRRSLESHGVEQIAISREPRFDAALLLLEQLASGSGAA